MKKARGWAVFLFMLASLGAGLRADNYGIVSIGMSPFDLSGYVPAGLKADQGWSKLDIGETKGYAARMQLGWGHDFARGFGSQVLLDLGWPSVFQFDQTNGSGSGGSGGDQLFMTYGLQAGPSYRINAGGWRIALAPMLGLSRIMGNGAVPKLTLDSGIALALSAELQFDYVGQGGVRPGLVLGYTDSTFKGEGPCGLAQPVVRFSGLYATVRLLFGIGK